MKIIIAATYGWSLINFRGELIKEWVKRGHEVFCLSIEPEEEMKGYIERIGAHYYQIKGDRTGINVFKDIKMIINYIKIFRKIKPDACFLYMSKPIAYGGIAARLCKIPKINIMISGLEIAFYKTDFRNVFIRQIIKILYRLSSNKADNVFFQNNDDMNRFLNDGIVSRKQAALVNGSGVDMTYFIKSPIPDGDDVVLMVARLVRYKGVYEFLDAAKEMKKINSKVRFVLLGNLDNNSDSITQSELDEIVKEKAIEYAGYTYDIRPFLQKCSIFVLPSRFEGTPRSVLEAMATGRPIITTDAPGCRETVEDGYNGFLIKCGDSGALVDRICKLVENRALRNKMGQNSYQMCQEKYDVKKVNKVILEKMKFL